MKRVGIVGCGGIARVHAWALSDMPDVEIVAMADCIPERAAEMSKEYTDGHAKAYASMEEMLDGSQIDVLHICTPHYLHVPMAIAALKRGISVFSEKPPAITMEEFEKLRKATMVSKGRLGFCFQNRYIATIKKAEDILNNGELGKIIGARAFVTWKRDEDYYKTDWKGSLSTEGGGVLINQAIHSLDLMLRFLGNPVTIKSTVSNHHLEGKIEVEDTVEAWIEFEEGQRACFYASNGYAVDAPVILEYTCEKGSVTVIDKLVLVNGENKQEQFLCDEQEGIGKSCWGSGHRLCIKDFYEKLENGEKFQNDLDGVEKTMRVFTEIYKSRKTGKH